MAGRQVVPETRAPGRGGHTAVRLFAVGLIVLGLVGMLGGDGYAQANSEVWLVDISGEIDLGLAPFLERSLREAEDAGAAAVLLDIDTPGGRLDAVLQMRDALLASPVRSIAFVDRTALSAGALIALASETILMAPGGVIGAATPVDGTGMAADEKVISAVSSIFRSTAEERGRDPLVAEAMVDPDVAIEGVVASGELLTLTTSEALELDFVDGQATDLDDALVQAGLEDAQLVGTSIALAERLARLVSSSLLSALLLAGGVLLLLGDLLSGGIGIGAALGVGMLGLFLGGNLIAGLAGWEDVALVVIGVILLMLEVFVLPGVGIAGFLGMAAILGGGFLATLNRDWDVVSTPQLVRSAATIGIAFVIIVVGFIALMVVLTRRPSRNRLVLGNTLGDSQPVTERTSRGWLGWFDADAVLQSDRDEWAAGAAPVAADGSELPAPVPGSDDAAAATTPSRGPGHLPRPDSRPGAVGVAVTDLRPAGVAMIAGRRVDVVTEGEYLHAGDPVEVLVDEGYRRLVRRAPGQPDG